MSKTIKTLHTETGIVSDNPENYLTHPKFKKFLVAVDEESKSYVPELYKPKSADEFKDSRAQSVDADDIDEIDEDTD